MLDNWKTTLGGLLFLVGNVLATSSDPRWHAIGVAVLSIGGAFGFVSAEDAHRNKGAK